MPSAPISTVGVTSVVVVGGGASGLMAAVAAAEGGARVTLLERNEKLGKKLYITGKGRCNVTHQCDAAAFRQSVVRNPRFLYSALDALSPDDLRARLERWGCPTMVERGDRVFPVSEKASDVTRAFERELRRLGVTIRLNARVQALETDRRGESGERCVSGVTLASGERIAADAVILCTGGRSYPTTGSTGDGYALLAGLGHTVIPPTGALVPLRCGEKWVTELQGLSLQNVRLTLTRGKKTLYAELGEMLFTHFGVSGPLVLSASSYMAGLDPAECAVTLDLKPGLTAEKLDERIQRDVREAGRKELGTVLRGLYPARLADAMAALCGLDARKPANLLTREERAAIVTLTKSLPLPVTGAQPVDEAIVTRGGADVRELDPRTMGSKLVPGLYVSGELVDVDGLTGGFNLHIAFATGLLAGRAAAAR